MDKMKANYEVMLGLAAEMLLDEALIRFRKEKIYAAIDDALESGDKESFEKLAAQWNTLQR
ncbi:IDEAL domain-containing protein [Paenibacillus albicereus]|uniref:IDEAL domain-containing protein n=1 Tax=Paenibacillus albicereus TaxID=2726185 RepID=A0A6H2GWV9_9BACL|nr:IDEAL domain-containing protein [Paenibacillus albicereus]QJC51885.1 IDEAL domain-containing protein [Paenibacillus albicereus]